jgi:hypothetical protein
MTSTETETTDREKQPSLARYPYYSLARSLKVAETVAELGGNRQEVQRSLIAQNLKVADSSASLVQLLGAAKCFGLIEGRGAFKLTPLAIDYLFPADENQKRNALLRVVNHPAVFTKLIDRFDGNKAPSTEILINLLQREEIGVPKSWASRIASLFMSALRDTSILDSDGFIRYGAALHTTQTGTPPDSRTASDTKPPQNEDREKGAVDTQQRTLPLDVQNKARQFTFTGPVAISRAEYDRICSWLKFQMIVEEVKENQE